MLLLVLLVLPLLLLLTAAVAADDDATTTVLHHLARAGAAAEAAEVFQHPRQPEVGDHAQDPHPRASGPVVEASVGRAVLYMHEVS